MRRTAMARTRSSTGLRSNAPRWIAAPALIALVLSTGCSVKTTGVTGVGIDRSGKLVGYVQMCSDRIDGTSLYETDGDTLGRWDAPGAVTDFATWTLNDPGDWTATERVTAPSSDKELSIYVWTNDYSTSSEHVTFRLKDLDGMKPGEVLYGDSSVGFRRVSEAEFQRHACDEE
jgi:hypothetical protein